MKSITHFAALIAVWLSCAVFCRMAHAQNQNWAGFSNALAGGNPTLVNAIAVRGTNLYVGGDFSSAGGASANRIAKWDGLSWSSLGAGSSNGFDLPALAIAIAPVGEVYVGGRFSQAGGASASRIAKWDGANWISLGNGLTSDGWIDAIAIAPGGDVYAGGIFSSIGGVNANNIARWDGTNWWDVGGGITRGPFSAVAKAIVVAGSDVYVGGSFDTAGGTPAVGIARWDGSNWSAVGGGVAYPGFNPAVDALTVDGTNLYVGGVFTQAGGVNASRIARWDGQSWFPFGNGPNSDVRSIVVFGNEMFVGGNFTSVDGQNLIGLARWLGNRWWPVASGIGGVQPYVNQLAANQTALFVGGSFTLAGGQPSTSLARWNLTSDGPVIQITDPTNNAVFRTLDRITISADAASPNGPLTGVEFFADAASLGVVSNSPYTISWTNATAGTHALTAKATDETGANQISATVNVTVNPTVPGPSITQQPQSQTVSNSASVILEVEAAGTGSLKYQWLKDGAPLSGATNSTITLNNAQLADAARYVVAVTDNTGTTTSSEAVVSVLQPVSTIWVQHFGIQVRTSPAIGEGGVVYLGSDSKNLFAFGPNRAYLWRFPTGDYVQSSASIATDGTIYFGSHDRNVYALKPDGTKKWEFGTGFTVVSSPAIGLDGTIYIGSGDQKLYALNPDGTKKWEFLTQGEVASAPVIGADGTIYFTSGDQKLYALGPDGTKKWEYPTGGIFRNSPVLAADGAIYIASSDKKLNAVNPDGSQRWQFTGDGPFASSPVIGQDGTIYVGNDGIFDPVKGTLRGRLYAINPDGSRKWEFITGEAVRSSPAVARDGTIYFGSFDNKFYALNANGTEKWEMDIGWPIESSPAIRFDGVVYFGAQDGNLYAVQGSSPLADSPWPMFQRDHRHSGNAAAPRVPDVWFYPFQSNSFDDQVRVITVANGNLYVGGDFQVAGGVGANHIARWDGTSWSALGDGVNGPVASIAAVGSNVFVGGQFSRAGDVEASFIARWDGARWSALEDGSREPVNALAVLNNQLYAARSFTNSAGTTINGVSKWDGQTWTLVGEGLGQPPLALVSDGVRLYAGGFTGYLVTWDGNAWSPLGGGIVGSVWAIAVAGNNVYVGGDISRAGGLNGIAVSGIARWDGSTWSNLGNGVTNRDILIPYVFAIAVDGTNVFAGGSFLGAGGVAANSIARWDSTSWHALSSGVAGDVPSTSGAIRALGVLGGNIYAGGVFYAAGGDRNIRHFARWNASGWSSVGPLLTFSDGKFQLILTDQIGRTYGIESSPDLQTWARVVTYTNIGAVVRFVDEAATNSSRRFYRAVTP